MVSFGVVSVVWAILVGGLMAGTASFLGVREPDVQLIGVLGGLGAEAFVYVFSSRK